MSLANIDISETPAPGTDVALAVAVHRHRICGGRRIEVPRGKMLGGSSGINVAGAVRLAKELGPGHTIVTILADYGTRYQSKLFNPQFLRQKNLPVPLWLERKPDIAVPYQ